MTLSAKIQQKQIGLNMKVVLGYMVDFKVLMYILMLNSYSLSNIQVWIKWRLEKSYTWSFVALYFAYIL